MGRHSASFDASEGRRLRQEFARQVLCKRQRLFQRRKLLRINFHPARARTDATRGRGNEPGKTIACTAHNTVGRFGRRVHPPAKFPGKAVLWVSRLLRSSHPPRQRMRSFVQEALSGPVPLPRLYSRRCRQYTPVRRPLPPCGAPYLLRRGSSHGRIVPFLD
jgi:hypothetical protein